MAARLPKPGDDAGDWGALLNDFLLVSHYKDGKLKVNVVNTSQLKDKAIVSTKLDSQLQNSIISIASKYSKLPTGIPMSDLAPTIQAALDKATTAVQPAPNAVPVTVSTSVSTPYYAPEDYGCLTTATASVNDAAIAAAIQDAAAGNGVVQFTGRGPYNVSRAIEQDVTQFVVRGVGTMLDVSDSFSGSYFWHIYSSANYPYSRNQVVALSGVILVGTGLGSTPIAAAAIQIGHPTYTNNCLFSLENIYIQGFATGINYIQNAWRVKVSNSRITGGTAIAVAAGLSNFGEAMLLENCIIESYNPTVNISTGEWNFINCSFNNTLITLNGNCVVKLHGCHLEPHTVYPCINVANAQAMLTLENSTLVIDPSVVIGLSAFNVIGTNTSYGLIIRNLDTIQSANYTPQVNSQDCLLVSGGGRVDIQGFSSNTNGYGYAIATSNNSIYNGDGEKASTVGWTTYGAYGGPSTFTADTAAYRYGSHALKLTTSAGSIYVGQAVPCQPGQWVFAQCWNKLTIDSGTANTAISLDFLSSKADVIKTIGYTNTTATTDWTCRRQLTGTTPVAPSGTASVRAYIGLVGSASASAWYDDIIVNVA